MFTHFCFRHFYLRQLGMDSNRSGKCCGLSCFDYDCDLLKEVSETAGNNILVVQNPNDQHYNGYYWR